jgi:hypothetical protein
MARCPAAVLHFNTIPAGFNAPLKFLTGFTANGKFPLRSLRPFQFQCHKVVGIRALKLDHVTFPPREIPSKLES